MLLPLFPVFVFLHSYPVYLSQAMKRKAAQCQMYPCHFGNMHSLLALEVISVSCEKFPVSSTVPCCCHFWIPQESSMGIGWPLIILHKSYILPDTQPICGMLELH